MYEAFFGLKRRPFLFVPDVETYFPSSAMEESCSAVDDAIQKGEGISLIFGNAGVGKTLLMYRILQSLESEYTVAFVSNCRLETSKALFCQLSHDLYVLPFVNEVIELRLKILDFARQDSTRGVVLLFDDAQYLSQEVLEEIRLLTDPFKGSLPLFRAVLAGTMEFEEKLTLPELAPFNQRVASRNYLATFTKEETSLYITRQTDDLRIDASKKESTPLFTEVAKQQIHRLTEGVPRFINQLCGTALQVAAAKKQEQITETLVEESWASLHHIESMDETIHSVSAVAQQTAISPKQIEQIIDQKRKTFQLRPFNSIEFGTLTDPEPESAEAELLPSTRSSLENEYKPPYPEDDEVVDESENEITCRDVSAYRLQIHVPDEEDAVDTKQMISPVEVSAPRKGKLTLNFHKRRRRYRRKLLLQQVQYRLGLFAGLHQPIEIRQAEPIADESEMNSQSLREYGAAVLDGRPPFVRKELHYAYQAMETAPLQYEGTYPDPKTGVPVILRWVAETSQEAGRFGVSYSDFLSQETGELRVKVANRVPTSSVIEKRSEAVSATSASSTAITERVVRTSLKASQDNPAIVRQRQGLDETFEESHRIEQTAISLAELFQVRSLVSQRQQASESADLKNWDESVQSQLETVIKRITRAADKIEHAAEVSERAGQHVTQAAEFVEMEVKSSLPNYIDLFRELSEFQKQVSAELDVVRQKNAEPPKFRTFPRRQVMIERTVPTIDVELLLR